MTSEGSSTDIANYYESICYANAVKEDKNEKIGLSVKRSPAWDTLYISGIKDTSKFAGSKLQTGMVILTINGMKCPKTVKEIQKVMKETEGNLTIMAATISKEINIIVESNNNANSPAHSPVRSSSTTAQVVATPAEGSAEMLKVDKSSDNLTASTAEPQTVDDGSDHPPSESLEMTLSNHQESFRNNNNNNHDDDDPLPRPVSPADNDYSPGSSPMTGRKVMNSGVRDSPVSISSIDHTGNIVVTPKGSPKDSVSKEISAEVEMPDLSQSEEGSSGEQEQQNDDQSDIPQTEEEEESSRKSATASKEEDEPDDTKLQMSPAPTKLTKTQQQQEQDDKAKKRAARSPRMAPGVSPGAVYVPSKRPSNSKNGKAHSLSPGPRNNRVRPGAQRVAGMNSRISEPAIPAPPMSTFQTTYTTSAARIRPENMPPPHPDRPGAHRIPGQNRRQASSDTSTGRDSPYLSPPARKAFASTKNGYVPPSSPVTSTSGPVDVDELEDDNDEIVRVPYDRQGSSPYNSRDSSVNGDLSKDDEYYSNDEFSRGSIEISEAPEMSVITSEDDLVIAAEVQENPEIVKERIRRQLMLETAKASVVMVERGGTASDDAFHEEEREIHKHKNVKEKLFGGGGKGRGVSEELSVNPDQYIRKREYLPWTVKRNTTTNMWIASVVTDQKAYDEGNKAEQERSKAVFSAKTEREAHETGLAMAAPYLQPVKNHPICVMCSSKFAVFNRPHNCRNCGVVTCSKCSVIWSSKRFPSTYQTSKSTHSVCLACDWSADHFQEAILQGNLQKAKKIYEAGNLNLRSPCISSKKKSGQEIMYPIHMAILGGNVNLVRWLCKERFVPVTTEVKSRGALKSLPVGTSKGRTPLKLAVKQKNHDMLKFLVAEMDVSLFDEDIKSDFRWILAHLSNTLHRAPYEYEIANNNRKNKKQPGAVASSSTSSSQASPRSAKTPPSSMEARVQYAGHGSSSVGTHQSQSSRQDSRGEC